MPLRNFMSSKSTRNQYFAAISVNLMTLSHGIAIGWLSPSLPYLRSEESHLASGPLTSENVSWIGSLSAFGAFFGAVIFGKISQKFGQKLTLILLVIPHLTFWALVFMSTHFYHLYIARVCAGLTGGGTIRTLSLFITEISENTIRGELGSYLILFLSTGNLVIFFAGTYLSFFNVPVVMIVFPILYLVTVSFLPDSPPSLMSRNKLDEAWDSLLFYRTVGNHTIVTEDFKEEYENLKKSLQNKGYDQWEWRDFTTPQAKKGLIIGLFLMFLNQFSGSFAIMVYTADIFRKSGSDLSPNESSIIVAVIQLIGVYVSTICVERCGRKILMTISCIGSAVFLCVLSMFIHFKDSGVDLSNFGWLPITCLSCVVFIASLGIIALPFVITTELLPNNIRGVACTICMVFVTVSAFSVLKIFPILVEQLGLDCVFLIFAAVCIFGAVIEVFFIPETRGKKLYTEDDKELKEITNLSDTQTMLK